LNRLSQFWQELKRRKVVRVITVYAAAAFVILELVSIIAEPLKLPEWFLTMVIVLLCIGFIIATIVSWVYDIKPEGDIVKTKPVQRAKADDLPSSSNRWKIASYISFLVIVALIVLNILPRSNRSEKVEILDKSIAVLPFTYLGDEPDKQYLADGTMDEILLNLSKIKDLRVMSRTSVEQYRNTAKTITEICEELGVAFLLEGSFQKIDNQVRLIVQLIEPGKEGHAWAKKYDRSWTDIFAVQSEVAQLVAQEIQAVITDEEKQLIEKIPTANLTAYDFFTRGREEHEKYWYDSKNREALGKAEDFYFKALEYDSTYAQAYTGLAYIYSVKNQGDAFFSENFQDSVLILANKALTFDKQLSEAYVLRGRYFNAHNKRAEAVNEFYRALQFNPNEWLAYLNLGDFYITNDNVKAIDNYHRAASLYRGDYLPRIYQRLGQAYAICGFLDKYKYYKEEALKLDDDSARYYWALAQLEDVKGNFENAVELGKKSYAMDSTYFGVIHMLGLQHLYLGQVEESLKYYEKFIGKVNFENFNNYLTFHIGYAYWVNGFLEEADYYFNKGLEFFNDLINADRLNAGSVMNYYLAAFYAFKMEKERALEVLRLINQDKGIPLYLIKDLINDPMFDKLRGEAEFQQILTDMEANYQAEHERVRQWLEENEML
jgi:TolB-like protein/Flp pilus assembly protein TadD